MIDKEKLIELLNGFSTPVTLNGEKLMDWNIPMPGLRKAIADHLLTNGVTFAKDTNVPSWIPVSERLPGKNGDYLVFKGSSYGGWCEVVGFAKDGSEVDEYDLGGCENVWYDYDSEYGYIAFDSVTHWMPLPEPPKEE